jgi:Tol biopolymer transport system component
VDIVDDIIFYGLRADLRASRIDLQSLTLKGEAIAVADGIMRRGRHVAASDSFTLMLQPLDRAADGTETALPVAATGFYRWPRLSPDGRRLAIGTARGMEVVDLDRRASWLMDGLTEPVWTPDGQYVIMSNGDRPRAALHRQVADGSRPADTLLIVADGDAYPTSVSPDGAWLAYYGQRDAVDENAVRSELSDLYFMELKTRVSRRLALPGGQFGARFSPNQRWVAYTSEEDGRQQVQIRDWPALASRYVVSNDGGRVPVWSNDGRTLYYRRRDDMMAVTIGEAGGVLTVSPPRVHFSGRYRYDPSGDQDYDIAPDGRFVMVKSRGGDRVVIDVTLNWIADVKARLDAKRR